MTKKNVLPRYLSIAWTNASGSILTRPPFQDFKLVQSGWRCREHLRWWVLKNFRVEPADLTPGGPLVTSYIFIGNCSKWLTQAFNLDTSMVKLVTVSMSGNFSVSAFFEHPINTVRKVRTLVILSTSWSWPCVWVVTCWEWEEEVSALESGFVKYDRREGTSPDWVTSNGDMSFSTRILCISRRHLSPSLGFLARWSTCAESLLSIVSAGWREPRLSLKCCSRNLPAWSRTHILTFSLVCCWLGVEIWTGGDTSPAELDPPDRPHLLGWRELNKLEAELSLDLLPGVLGPDFEVVLTLLVLELGVEMDAGVPEN